MYNMLFGKNPDSNIILKMIGLTEGDCGRFRDCYIERDNILIFTRLGGGNRECLCSDEEIKNGHDCYQKYIQNLQKNKFYVKDWDDDFDCTYAYFEFEIPEPFKEIANKYATKGENLKEKFDSVIEEMKKLSVDELKQDPRFTQLVQIMETISDNTKIEDRQP